MPMHGYIVNISLLKRIVILAEVKVTVVGYKRKNMCPREVMLAEEALLHSLGLVFTVLAFWLTRQLKFSIATRQSKMDEFLLYTAFFFTLNYLISTISLVAATDTENAVRNSF
ncbi:unnamed protein product [Protopolystoma xenopodis]|uniref:Uncharacterized protein n=1 Tax=Protopolystoma xenopodis TaxID=117903 RepID=A0A3S5BI86_9PLAT|nr:unnamed protein product [Protopolystoma xenopodis]